jgi:hypothetical protein
MQNGLHHAPGASLSDSGEKVDTCEAEPKLFLDKWEIRALCTRGQAQRKSPLPCATVWLSDGEHMRTFCLFEGDGVQMNCDVGSQIVDSIAQSLVAQAWLCQW